MAGHQGGNTNPPSLNTIVAWITVAAAIVSTLFSVAAATQQFSKGLIVGLVSGGIALLGLIALLAYKMWRTTSIIIGLVLALWTGYLLKGLSVSQQPIQAADFPEMNATLLTYTPEGATMESPFYNADNPTFVPVTISVQGSVVNIDKPYDLWAIDTQQNNVDHHYLHRDGPCKISNTADRFECTNIVVGRRGEDVGSRWHIILVRVPDATSKKWSQQIAAKNFDIDELPPDVLRLDVKSVVRS